MKMTLFKRRSYKSWTGRSITKEQDVVMDELLPKATSREAMLEKKALRRQHARAPEDSPELLKEKDVMGGGDDFQQRYDFCCKNSLPQLIT